MNAVQEFRKAVFGEQLSTEGVKDESIPWSQTLVFGILLAVMAWRTLDILWLTTPDNWVGKFFAFCGLFAAEFAAIMWHSVGEHQAHTKNQKLIADIMLAVCIAFSVATSVADIVHFTGVAILDLDRLMSVAIIGSGVMVIANVVAIILYRRNSQFTQNMKDHRDREFTLLFNSMAHKQQVRSLEREVDEAKQAAEHLESLVEQAREWKAREQWVTAELAKIGISSPNGDGQSKNS